MQFHSFEIISPLPRSPHECLKRFLLSCSLEANSGSWSRLKMTEKTKPYMYVFAVKCSNIFKNSVLQKTIQLKSKLVFSPMKSFKWKPKINSKKPNDIRRNVAGKRQRCSVLIELLLLKSPFELFKHFGLTLYLVNGPF